MCRASMRGHGCKRCRLRAASRFMSHHAATCEAVVAHDIRSVSSCAPYRQVKTTGMQIVRSNLQEILFMEILCRAWADCASNCIYTSKDAEMCTCISNPVPRQGHGSGYAVEVFYGSLCVPFAGYSGVIQQMADLLCPSMTKCAYIDLMPIGSQLWLLASSGFQLGSILL